MHGSSTEYIIEYRVQDYWLIYQSFWYIDRAQKRLAQLKQDMPDTDFRLIKRLTTFTDTEI